MKDNKKEEKINMFEKSQEDRRKKFVNENDYVADDIVSRPSDKVEGVVIKKGEGRSDNFLINQEERPKKRSGLYVEDRIDEFISKLSEISFVSKTGIVNQFLTDSIMYHEDMVELRAKDERVQKLYDDFINS